MCSKINFWNRKLLSPIQEWHIIWHQSLFRLRLDKLHHDNEIDYRIHHWDQHYSSKTETFLSVDNRSFISRSQTFCSFYPYERSYSGQKIELGNSVLTNVLSNFDDSIAMVYAFCDNTAKLSVALQLGLNTRTKHIKVRIHHICGLLSSIVILLQHIKSEGNVANLFASPVDRRTLLRLRKLIMTDSFASTIDVSQINQKLVSCVLMFKFLENHRYWQNV